MRDIAKLIGRILISALFLEAGWSEARNLAGTIGYFQGLGMPMPDIIIWGVLAIEIVGGLAILLGYRFAIATAVVGLFTIGAAAIGHSNFADLREFQAFMKDFAIAGGLFFMAACGPGRHSVDRRGGI